MHLRVGIINAGNSYSLNCSNYCPVMASIIFIDVLNVFNFHLCV